MAVLGMTLPSPWSREGKGNLDIFWGLLISGSSPTQSLWAQVLLRSLSRGRFQKRLFVPRSERRWQHRPKLRSCTLKREAIILPGRGPWGQVRWSRQDICVSPHSVPLQGRASGQAGALLLLSLMCPKGYVPTIPEPEKPCVCSPHLLHVISLSQQPCVFGTRRLSTFTPSSYQGSFGLILPLD